MFYIKKLFWRWWLVTRKRLTFWCNIKEGKPVYPLRELLGYQSSVLCSTSGVYHKLNITGSLLTLHYFVAWECHSELDNEFSVCLIIKVKAVVCHVAPLSIFSTLKITADAFQLYQTYPFKTGGNKTWASCLRRLLQTFRLISLLLLSFMVILDCFCCLFFLVPSYSVQWSLAEDGCFFMKELHQTGSTGKSKNLFSQVEFPHRYRDLEMKAWRQCGWMQSASLSISCCWD